MLLNSLPKALVSFVFLFDILVLNKLYLFYWFLPILFIPLILQYLKYVIFEDYFIIKNKLENVLEIYDIIPGSPDNILPIINLDKYLNNMVPLLLIDKNNPYQENIHLSLAFFQNLSEGQLDIKIDYKKSLYWIQQASCNHML